MYCLAQWFLTLLEVLNPASFISALAEPFGIGKIKYDSFKTLIYILWVHKMNHASVLHKITVFKQQNKLNMNSTQKLNEYFLQIKVT